MANTKTGEKNKRDVTRQKPLPGQLQKKVQDVTDEVVRIAKQAKRRFNRMDTDTKRKVVAGLSGLAALLALRARHRFKKSRKK